MGRYVYIIEYVPSQVVSEFFAQVFRTEAVDQLDAVIYPSSEQRDYRHVDGDNDSLRPASLSIIFIC